MLENLDLPHPLYERFVSGWKKDDEDTRDFLYKTQAPLETPDIIPNSGSLAQFMPPVFQQETLGSCTGHGVAEVLGYLRLKDPNLDDWWPSRLLIYKLELLLEQNFGHDDGAQIRDGIKAIGQYGTVPESEYPYLIEKFAEEIPQHIYDSAVKHKAFNYYRVNWEDWEEITGCLAAGFPIVFGFVVYKEFVSRRVAKTGILTMPTDLSHNEGGHCVCCFGWDNKIQFEGWDEPGGVLVRNSWGKEWGQDGNFWMPKKYITSPKLSDDFWTVRAMY